MYNKRYNSLELGESYVVAKPAYARLDLGTFLVYAKPSREERKKAKAKELKKAEKAKKPDGELVKNPNPEGRQEMVTKDYAEQFEREHGGGTAKDEESDLDKYLGKPGEPEPEKPYEEPEQGSDEAESFEHDKKFTRQERKEYDQAIKEQEVEPPTTDAPRKPEKKPTTPEEHKTAAKDFIKSEGFQTLKKEDQNSIQDFVSSPTPEATKKIGELIKSKMPNGDGDGWKQDDYSMRDLTEIEDTKEKNFWESLLSMYDEFKREID